VRSAARIHPPQCSPPPGRLLNPSHCAAPLSFVLFCGALCCFVVLSVAVDQAEEYLADREKTPLMVDPALEGNFDLDELYALCDIARTCVQVPPPPSSPTPPSWVVVLFYRVTVPLPVQ